MPSVNSVKNTPRGPAGDDTFLVMHNFIENDNLKNCATKKCLNLLCNFFHLLRAGDFRKKNWDNTFFLWGGEGGVTVVCVCVRVCGWCVVVCAGVW